MISAYHNARGEEGEVYKEVVSEYQAKNEEARPSSLLLSF
jgi:hypothetical protein